MDRCDQIRNLAKGGLDGPSFFFFFTVHNQSQIPRCALQLRAPAPAHSGTALPFRPAGRPDTRKPFLGGQGPDRRVGVWLVGLTVVRGLGRE
jgi:hypothetical protein